MSGALPAGHEVRILGGSEAWIEGAARAIIEALTGHAAGARMVLAGGRTPVPVYERLARPSGAARLDWRRVRFTFSDERAVPPDDRESNYAMARRALLAPLSVREDRVLRLRGEDPVEQGAEKAHRSLLAWAQRVPLFDLVLLGLGDDGHVASLFPAESWPDFGTRLAVPTRHPEGQERITLTPSTLCRTGMTIFLVRGKGKAAAVRDALSAGSPTPEVPSRMTVREGSRALWILDEEAASLLPEELRGGKHVSLPEPTGRE